LVLKKILHMKLLLTITLMIFAFFANSQTFNAAFQDINFGGTGVTITNKVGTGFAAGDVVLYEDVITIGSQAIDAIVRTISVDPSMTYHDNASTSGSAMTNNEPRFFSPQFNFSSSGEAEFRFEFILGGSYNNSTDSGTIITLENIMINTYDIDGNGSSGTNQYNQYGGFYSTYLSSSTNIQTNYDVSSGLTNFRSGTSGNVSNVLDDDTRVQVAYYSISTFPIVVGAEGSGYAYFFIDFGTGASWSTPPDTISAPVVDLDTISPGNNSSDTFCLVPSPITNGGTNITTTNSTVDELIVTFDSADIIDGTDEVFVILGATTGDTVPLYFTTTTNFANVTLDGVIYTATGTVSGEQRIITFERLSGLMSVPETENLLDSIAYYNAMPSTALRQFEITIRSGPFTSVATEYEVYTSCSFLFVHELDLDAVITKDQNVLLNWRASNEDYTSHYTLEKSVNPEQWTTLVIINKQEDRYSFIDADAISGENCYRLTQFSVDGTRENHVVSCIENNSIDPTIDLFPNPSHAVLNISCNNCKDPIIKVLDGRGLDVTNATQRVNQDDLVLDISGLRQGFYIISIETNSTIISKPFSIIP
jgi:Tfp pilus assembly protein PilX